MKRIKLTDNFYADEFQCECGCGKSDIDMKIVWFLQYLRESTNEILNVNCGCRCEFWNATKKRSLTSSHLLSLAVDIRMKSLRYRFLILDAIFKAPINFKYSDNGLIPTRIGIAQSFIHLDIDFNKVQDLVWVY